MKVEDRSTGWYVLWPLPILMNYKQVQANHDGRKASGYLISLKEGK